MPTDIKQKFISFFNGYLFPLYIAFFVLLGYLIGLVHLSIFFIVAASCLGFVICNDLKFFISPLLCSYFMFSKEALSDEGLYSTSSLIFFGMCILALATCIAVHFIIFRKEIKVRRFVRSSLFKGFVILTALFLLNGFFNFKEYNKENIIFGALIAVSFVLPFFIFSINMRIDKKTAKYLVYVLLVVSFILAVELISLYFTTVEISAGKIMKHTIDLGWGVSNNIGAMLAMLMPVHFYCAVKSKHSVPFFLSGVICYLLTVLSMSRTSIIFASIALLFCLGFLCIHKHKNIMANRYSVVAFFFFVAFALIIFEDKLERAFEGLLLIGFDDNGRMEYYSDGIQKFLSHPIFGAGFGNSHGVNDKFVIAAPEYFHNTVIQMLASCGALGFLAYAYHRFETVKLFIKHKTPLSFFFGMSIMTLLLSSLLDIHIFNVFPAIFYSVILCVLERDGKYRAQRSLNHLTEASMEFPTLH